MSSHLSHQGFIRPLDVTTHVTFKEDFEDAGVSFQGGGRQPFSDYNSLEQVNTHKRLITDYHLNCWTRRKR